MLNNQIKLLLMGAIAFAIPVTDIYSHSAQAQT